MVLAALLSDKYAAPISGTPIKCWTLELNDKPEQEGRKLHTSRHR